MQALVWPGASKKVKFKYMDFDELNILNSLFENIKS